MQNCYWNNKKIPLTSEVRTESLAVHVCLLWYMCCTCRPRLGVVCRCPSSAAVHWTEAVQSSHRGGSERMTLLTGQACHCVSVVQITQNKSWLYCMDCMSAVVIILVDSLSLKLCILLGSEKISKQKQWNHMIEKTSYTWVCQSFVALTTRP